MSSSGYLGKIYVAGNNTVTMITAGDDTVTRQTIPVGKYPRILFSDFMPETYITKHYTYSYHYHNQTVFRKGEYHYHPLIEKTYVLNWPNTISVINPINGINEQNITLPPKKRKAA
jgi:hypothetical protein